MSWIEEPCPDERHDFKQTHWANGCPTCHGRGAVVRGKQRITVVSGPEAVVTRSQDLGDR